MQLRTSYPALFVYDCTVGCGVKTSSGIERVAAGVVSSLTRTSPVQPHFFEKLPYEAEYCVRVAPGLDENEDNPHRGWGMAQRPKGGPTMTPKP